MIVEFFCIQFLIQSRLSVIFQMPEFRACLSVSLMLHDTICLSMLILDALCIRVFFFFFVAVNLQGRSIAYTCSIHSIWLCFNGVSTIPARILPCQ